MQADVKEERLNAFSTGEVRILLTKPSIAGYGLNWQHCNRMTYFPSHSYEQWYQAVRRCWRFGQKRAVEVHVFASELEGAVVKNVERKAKDAEAMSEALSKETAGVVRAELRGAVRLSSNADHKTKMKLPSYITTRGA
jgi:SNF2 family DNA or RNA helicase